MTRPRDVDAVAKKRVDAAKYGILQGVSYNDIIKILIEKHTTEEDKRKYKSNGLCVKAYNEALAQIESDGIEASRTAVNIQLARLEFLYNQSQMQKDKDGLTQTKLSLEILKEISKLTCAYGGVKSGSKDEEEELDAQKLLDDAKKFGVDPPADVLKLIPGKTGTNG